jgi:transposase
MDKLPGGLELAPELLGLSEIEVISVKLTRQGSVYVLVKSTRKEILCKKCNGPTVRHGHGRRLKLRHLPIFDHEVYIEIISPRGTCKRCDNNPTTTQTLDWFTRNSHNTKPFEDYLMRQLIGSTLADVAKKENVTEEILQGVVDHYQVDEVNWKEVSRIGLLGIDEISKLKGHGDYITLVTSRYRGKNKILAVLEGKEKSTIKGFLRTIPQKKRKTITAVCVDMCDNYIHAIKETLSSDIPIVVDRFHVAKLYRKAITQLRSSELKRLRKLLSEEDYRALKPAIKILIKKSDCYSAKEKKVLAPLFKYSPAIKAAYRLAREFTHIYNSHHRKGTAKRNIKSWIEKVEASDISCLNVFIKTVAKYQEPISNYFIRRETSGWVEGVNNKIKVIKRRCYGITNLKHFFQRIFLDLQGYDIFLNKQSVTTI